MLNVKIRKRSVQIPVESRMSSSGFALNRPFTIAVIRRAIGARQTRNTAALINRHRLKTNRRRVSVIFAEVHAGIQLSDLIRIAVE